MTNPLFEQELTAQEVARYVAGVYASLEVIESTLQSESTASEMSQTIGKNHQFISIALSIESIREAIEDVAGVIQSLREAHQAYASKVAEERAARAALPKPNPLLAHLEELGL